MKPPPLIIGLSGKSGSGKSTAAAYLAEFHGYQPFAFADALKEIVQTAFNFSAAQMEGYMKEIPDPRFHKSPRWCLQHLGTDVFRAIWPDIWIYHLRRDLLDFLSLNGARPCVVTDVRFRDEAEALEKMKGVLWRIEREDHRQDAGGTGIAGHVSENELDCKQDWDRVILNHGDLMDLHSRIEEALYFYRSAK
jgi:hypothetical protein